MNSIQKDVKIVIENQQVIINELLDIKRRVRVIENVENTKKNDERMLFQYIQGQKDSLQEKIDTIEIAIKLLDDKLGRMKADKDSEARKTFKPSEKEMKTKQCKYDRKGFCRNREKCAYFHAFESCDDFVVTGICSKSGCDKRHPKTCYNFIQSECRWGQSCRYLHREQMIQIIVKHQEENEKELDNKERENCEISEEDDTYEVDCIDKNIDCKECTQEDKYVNCIMKHVLTDHGGRTTVPCTPSGGARTN